MTLYGGSLVVRNAQIGLLRAVSCAWQATDLEPIRTFQTVSKAKFGKGHRTGGPLARIEVFGLLHAVLERKAGEGFFCRVAAEPCPLFFGDPESGFYPRFLLRRPREEVLRFLVEALRFHRPILA